MFWLSWFFLGAAAACGGAAAVALLDHLHFWAYMSENPAASGWVQAFGSIAAIGTSFAVVHFQHQQERRRERERDLAERRRLIAIVRDLVSDARSLVGSIGVACSKEGAKETAGDRRQYDSSFQSILHALEAIPVHCMPSAYSARSLLDAIKWVRRARELVIGVPLGEAVLSGSSAAGQKLQGPYAYLNDLVDYLNDASHMLDGSPSAIHDA